MVGPDLLTLSDASPESLLVAILDPNRAYEAKYSDYTVHAKDGRVLAGMIAGETANSLTLLRPDGREDVLLRSEIEAVAASGRSLMPEGLEKEITPRDLADLVAYLGALRSPPKPEGPSEMTGHPPWRSIRWVMIANRPGRVARLADPLLEPAGSDREPAHSLDRVGDCVFLRGPRVPGRSTWRSSRGEHHPKAAARDVNDRNSGPWSGRGPGSSPPPAAIAVPPAG